MAGHRIPDPGIHVFHVSKRFKELDKLMQCMRSQVFVGSNPTMESRLASCLIENLAPRLVGIVLSKLKGYKI